MFYRSELLSELETIADRRMSKNVIDTILNSTHYSDEKKKYIKSVYERFGESPNFEYIKSLLLSDTQMDENLL